MDILTNRDQQIEKHCTDTQNEKYCIDTQIDDAIAGFTCGY